MPICVGRRTCQKFDARTHPLNMQLWIQMIPKLLPTRIVHGLKLKSVYFCVKCHLVCSSGAPKLPGHVSPKRNKIEKVLIADKQYSCKDTVKIQSWHTSRVVTNFWSRRLTYAPHARGGRWKQSCPLSSIFFFYKLPHPSQTKTKAW